MEGIYTFNTKSLRIDDLPPEAWQIVGGNQPDDGLKALWKGVPWLGRGVNLRAGALSSLPFAIYRDGSDEPIDTHEDYENNNGILPNLSQLLWLWEAGLTLFGRHYLEKTKNLGDKPLALRFLLAASIKPVMDSQMGLVGFKRKVNGQEIQYKPEELVYTWLPDPYVELGPPDWSPAINAMSAAGVLMSVDQFAKIFFDRGAIKTTLLAVKGTPTEAERERIGNVWGRLSQGLKTAWRNLVMNADALEPITVGEGLESLANTSLTTEKREDIATGLGIPHSMLFSNAANFATAETDKMAFYEETIIPESKLIQSVLNEQYLKEHGLKLRFNAGAMDIFQTDEQNRSLAFERYVGAGLPRSMAAEMLGLELPNGITYDELDELPEPAPKTPFGGGGSGEPTAAEVNENTETTPTRAALLDDLGKWERKALKALERGKPASVPFESAVIDARSHVYITELLSEAENKADVKRIFALDI